MPVECIARSCKGLSFACTADVREGQHDSLCDFANAALQAPDLNGHVEGTEGYGLSVDLLALHPIHIYPLHELQVRLSFVCSVERPRVAIVTSVPNVSWFSRKNA